MNYLKQKIKNTYLSILLQTKQEENSNDLLFQILRTSMRKYGKVWESMGKYEKVWESMGKYGKV